MLHSHVTCLLSKIEGTEVSWRHLEAFYVEDKRSTIRMAPKLTEKHLNLPPFMNMRVKLATQLFSHSVAAGKYYTLYWKWKFGIKLTDTNIVGQDCSCTHTVNLPSSAHKRNEDNGSERHPRGGGIEHSQLRGEVGPLVWCPELEVNPLLKTRTYKAWLRLYLMNLRCSRVISLHL